MRARRRQEREAFAAFASGSAPQLLRAAQLLLRDAAAAEDAVQVTLLRVFQHWDRARENPGAYSRTVLANVCRDHWRRAARRSEPCSGELALELPDRSPSALDAAEDRSYLGGLLQALDDEPRAVLVLRYYLDLPVAETAELLDLPEGTVKSHASRALALLRQLVPEARKETPECSPTTS